MTRLASTCLPLSDDAIRAKIFRQVEFDTNGGCWLWTGATLSNGYGVVSRRGKSQKAHRVSYTLLREEIPPGLTIDHLCRVRCCINPAHLEVVTLEENVRRGTVSRPRPTHCPSGHRYSPENTAIHTVHGRFQGRVCITCRRATARRRPSRAKAKA